MKRVCKQCGKEFEMTQHEIQFYKKKKLSLPKRCKECREKNKATTKDDRTNRIQISPNSSVNKKQAAGNSVQEIMSGVPKAKRKKNLTGVITALFLVICGALAGINQFSSDPQDQNGGAPIISAEELEFRSEKLLEEHFEKHGIEMGFATAEEYEDAAADVVANSEALHKTEKEDGDDVYYLEDTNEFVIVSTDGYIRTYFEPEDGLEYYERQ